MLLLPESKVDGVNRYNWLTDRLNGMRNSKYYRIQISGQWKVGLLNLSNLTYKFYVAQYNEPFYLEEIECIDSDPIHLPGDHTLDLSWKVVILEIIHSDLAYLNQDVVKYCIGIRYAGDSGIINYQWQTIIGDDSLARFLNHNFNFDWTTIVYHDMPIADRVKFIPESLTNNDYFKEQSNQHSITKIHTF